MRSIAFIATNECVPWGGSEDCWAAAAERLARRGVQVHASVKAWGAPVKQLEQLRSVGCRIFYRAFPPPFSERIRRRILGDDHQRRHVRMVARGAELVIVSQGGHMDGLAWMEAARAERCRYAVISQSVSEQWLPSDDVGERLAKCFDEASAAYFVSEANLALTRLQLAAPLTRGRVIRNPFRVRHEAQPPWPGDPTGALSLACVARLDSAQKGQDLLIQVMDQPRWRARNMRVTLAGSGVHERVLRRMVAGLNLLNVHFAGYVGDIEELWARHHALVLPSRFEGMPLALVEAMLCGRPSIVTDVGGNSELVRDNVNGFLAKAPTIEFVGEALEHAWENRYRLREMGEAAARDVRQWVSADPTGDFVRELDALANGRVK
jgi:glycosyltransferase involved in cell wall biosynthesis